MDAMPRLKRELRDRIAAQVESPGMLWKSAAVLAGVPTHTFADWIERGRRERERRAAGRLTRRAESQYVNLLDALEVATRRHRERMRTAVEEAARQSPAAAQALRRLPDDSKVPVARQ